jgi:hypothetical protein
MSQPLRRRRSDLRPYESRPESDMDRVFGQLFPQPTVEPPKRNLRRVIREGDGSATAVNYNVTVDPMTGEQRVDVRVLTNKRECAQCGRLVSPLRLYECRDCFKKICGACLTSRKIFLGDKPVCLTCASLRR